MATAVALATISMKLSSWLESSNKQNFLVALKGVDDLGEKGHCIGQYLCPDKLVLVNELMDCTSDTIAVMRQCLKRGHGSSN